MNLSATANLLLHYRANYLSHYSSCCPVYVCVCVRGNNIDIVLSELKMLQVYRVTESIATPAVPAAAAGIKCGSGKWKSSWLAG